MKVAAAVQKAISATMSFMMTKKKKKKKICHPDITGPFFSRGYIESGKEPGAVPSVSGV